MRLEDFSMRTLRNHIRPLSGSFSQKKQHIPEMMGDYYFGTEIGSKTYEMVLTTWTNDWKTLEERLDSLNAFLFDANGQPKLLKCFFDNSDKFAFIYLKDQIIPDVSSVMEKIPITFVNYDGGEYSTSSAYDPETPLRYDDGHMYGEKGYANTTGFDWIYSRHYSGLENYSSLNTDIKITIKGTVKGGSVTHLESGVKLTFPDVTNGTIVIDGGVFNVQVNGVDTVFDGEFPVLKPGGNGFLFEAETVNATVSFDWYHKFM